MEELEVLVVEDREENRAAAQKYFDSRSDVNISFATAYDEGLKRLQENVYAFCIFDLEIPRKEGMEPEKLGLDLGKISTHYFTPWAVITAGIDHHQNQAAFVSYCWERKKESGFSPREITNTPKTNPKSWQNVYETLAEKIPGYYLKEMIEKKETHREKYNSPLTLNFEDAEMIFKISAKAI